MPPQPHPHPHPQPYNPNKLPCNPTTASQHRSATSSGRPTEAHKLCPCCLLPIMRTPLPINFDMKDIEHLGMEYQGLFYLGKVLGVGVGVVGVVTGLGQLQEVVWSRGGGAADGLFGVNWSTLSSNYPEQKFWVHSTVSFVTLILLLLTLHIPKFLPTNPTNPTPTYPSQKPTSILLQNLPKCSSPTQKIHDLLTTNFNNTHIKQIFLIPTMTTYQQLQAEMRGDVENWRKVLGKKGRTVQEILGALRRVQEGRRRLGELREEMQRNQQQYFSGNAIIVFSTPQTKQKILQQFSKKFLTKSKLQASFGQLLLQHHQKITAEQASAPTQINWYNIAITTEERKGRERFGWVLGGLAVVFVGLGYLGGMVWVGGRRIGWEDKKQQGNYVGSLLILSILNHTILQFLQTHTTTSTLPPTQTHSKTSLTLSLTLTSLLIHSLLILTVQSIFLTGHQLVQSTLNKIVIFWGVDFGVRVGIDFGRFGDWGKWGLGVLGGWRMRFTQDQANFMYMKAEFKIPVKYSILLSTTMTAVMFCNLLPCLLLLHIPTLLLTYHLTKLSLSKNSISPMTLSPNYLTTTIKTLQLVIILKPLMNFIFWSICKPTVAVQEIVMVGVGVGFWVGDKGRLVRGILRVFGKEWKQEEGEEEVEGNEGNQGENVEGNLDEDEDEELKDMYRIQCPITGGYAAKLAQIEKRLGCKAIINLSTIQQPDISSTITDTIPIIYPNIAPNQPINNEGNPNFNEDQQQDNPAQTERPIST